MVAKIADAVIDDAEQLLRSGMLLKEAAAEVGVSRDALARHLRARGVDTTASKHRPASNRIDLPVEEVVAAYESGESENAVAKRFGVARAVIRRHLNQAGVHVRTQSEAETLKWSQMAPEQREQQYEAAHFAATGRRPSADELQARAVVRQKNPSECFIGVGESDFGQFLQSRHIRFEYQAPIEGYNIDFLIGRVAVEITSARCRYAPNNAREIKRAKHLLDSAGIRTLAVVFDNVKTLLHFGDDVLAEADRLDRAKSFGREYWVIRCRRQDYAIVKNERMQFARVPAPVQFLKRRKRIKLR